MLFDFFYFCILFFRNIIIYKIGNLSNLTFENLLIFEIELYQKFGIFLVLFEYKIFGIFQIANFSDFSNFNFFEFSKL